MKHFTKPAFLVVFSVLSAMAMGQVTFTNQNDLLQSTSGWSSSDCAVDMNGDHLDDVVRVTSNGIYIDYQQPDGTFESEYFDMDIINEPNWSICAADIDENGYTDLCFGNGSRVSFCYANDDGTAYTEVDYPEYIFSQRSTFNDIDNDGEIDSFVCHDVDQSHPYRNDGDGNLVLDQTLIETLDVGGNYAAIWCDYDNDWDSDLYITKCRGGAPVGDPQRINLMYRNNGDGTFTEVGEEINMNDGDQSWTTLFEDFDNDGDFDSFTVNHAWANRFMENDGTGMFTDIIETTGIDAYQLGAWDCDAGDFDNNGFVDIYYDTGATLWLNNGDGTFTEGDMPAGDGGLGDFNDDGFIDLINGDNLWINDGNDNNWVKVGCEGIVSNKNGIGARIEIYGDWGIQIREIRSGESFSPMSSLTEHFGLGTATSIDQMIIKWPSGLVTVLEDPAINTTHIVPEAGCVADANTITVDGDLEICPGESVSLSADMGESYTWSNGEETQSIDVVEAGVYSVVIWDEEGCASISDMVTVTIIEDTPPSVIIVGEDVVCEGTNIILEASEGDNPTWSNGMTGSIIAVNESGEYYVSVDAICTVEQIPSEAVMVTILDAADEPVADDVVIPEPGTATLEATGDNLMWYETEDAVDAVGEGETFETPFIDEGNDLTYWVEANTIYGGEMQEGGKEDDAGGGGLPSSGGKLFFNVTEEFTLLEVTVYVPSGAPEEERTIQLFNQNNEVIAEHIEFFDEGTHTVELNFEVPMGDGLSIGATPNTFFRNDSGVNYPYDIGSVGTIYTSTFGEGYYYYFYDWQIQLEEIICPSDRVPVNASVGMVGVFDVDNLDSFSIFPNPVVNELNLSLELTRDAEVTMTLSDVSGKTVQTQDYGVLNGVVNRTIDCSAYAAGVYMLEVSFNDQVVKQRVVVK